MNTEEHYLWRAEQATDDPAPDPDDYCHACGTLLCRHGFCPECENCPTCEPE